jgi:antitoxin component of RelBE/YafQ-DinJ toxin-antitoxin module
MNLSILESIQAAEDKLEKMKVEATEQVRILLENTKVESEIKVKTLLEEAIQKEKEIDQKTLKKITELELEINLNYQNLEQKMFLLANSRMDNAIDFIMKKVFEI